MSPILVRPVREQLEHDRVIRLLQQDLQKKKVEVGINPGYEQNAGVGSGTRKEFPDAVIYALDKGRKVVAVVEVETGESVNDLEAKAQWAHLAKLRVPFHLYVPMGSVDVARRLSADNQIAVSEIWSYHQVGEQFKFTLIHPPGSGRGKSAQALRTVSVSTIRVPIPDPDASVVEEPEPPPAAVTSKAPRVIPAKAKAIPPVAAKPPGAAKAPVPAKPPIPSKAAPVVKTAAPDAAKKAPVPAKATTPGTSTAALKAPAAKIAGKAPAKGPAKVIAPAKPVKQTVKPVARSAAPRKAAKPVARASGKAAKPSKPARPVPKAAARKPAGKRK